MSKLTIIIPVYNEEHFLLPLLKKVVKAPVLGLQKEIMVINDGSTDQTKKILNHLPVSLKKRLCIIHLSKNQGKGHALRLGFQKGTGDFFLTQDADLEYNPADYPALLDPALKKQKRVVYGSRTLGISKFGNHYSSLPFFLGGLFLTYYLNFLFQDHLSDQATGYKLVDKNLAKEISQKTRENDFSFEIEMTALISQKKLSIHEVPIHYSPRTVAEGKKIKFRDFTKALWVALRSKYSLLEN